jgi:Domain of unknown function (DUF4383)
MATVDPTGRRTAYPADAAAPTTTRTEKGISLARGPALILGTILTAVGLYLLYKARTFPPFSNFPSGTATKDGNYIFGLFAANGWTAMLTAVAGGLLLFGAAQHLLAKTMSLIVGIALGAAAVIGFVSGDVLGMAASNGWTELGWGVCAVILLFNTLVPRRRRTVTVVDEAAAADAGRAPVAERGVAAERAPVERGVAAEREPVAERGGAAEREPVAEREPMDQGRAEDPAVARGEEPTVVHRGEAAPETRSE